MQERFLHHRQALLDTRRAFAAWRATSCWQARARQAVARALSGMAGRSQAACFREWRGRARWQARKRAAGRTARQRQLLQCLGVFDRNMVEGWQERADKFWATRRCTWCPPPPRLAPPSLCSCGI